MADHNTATRLLSVIGNQIESKTNSGAGIEVTYGQVFQLTAGAECSVYLAGSRELAQSDGGTPEPSEGFRIPGPLLVRPNDFVRVSMDKRGHRWIDEVFLLDPYSRLAIDANDGKILIGDGVSPLQFGQPGQRLAVSEFTGKMEYIDPSDMVFLPFSYSNPAAGVTDVEMRAIDSINNTLTPRMYLPWDAEIVGLMVRSSNSRTAGTLTVKIETGARANYYLNENNTDRYTLEDGAGLFQTEGTSADAGVTSVTGLLDGTTPLVITATGSSSLSQNKYTAGNALGITFSTSSDWLPTSTYLYGGIFAMVKRRFPLSSSAQYGRTFPANAVFSGAVGTKFFTANSVLKRTGISGTATGDAVIEAQATILKTFLANSVFYSSTSLLPTYYAATNTGSDTTGTGTLTNPWKTFSKGMSSTPVGGRLILRGGTYASTFFNARDTIRIENYPDENVIFERTTTGSVVNLENCRNITMVGGQGNGSIQVRNTLTNATNHSGNGAGIQCYYDSTKAGFNPANNVFSDLIVYSIPGYGIHIKNNSYAEVRNCEVYDCGTGIRLLGSSNSIVEDNTLHDMQRMIVSDATLGNDNGGVAIALDTNTNFCTVQRNYAYNCSAVSSDYGRDGGAVEIYQSHDNTIQFNTFESNEGGIETGTSDVVAYPTNNNKILFNQFYGSGNQNGASPILLFRAAEGLLCYHNTIDISSGNNIFTIQEGTGGYSGKLDNLKIKNNIIKVAGSGNKIYEFNKAAFTAPGIEIDYNLIYNSSSPTALIATRTGASYTQTNVAGWRSGTPYGDNDIWGSNPLYTSPATRDYHLLGSSPAINSGQVLPGYNDGYMGSAPERGMYEYNPPYLIKDAFSRNLTGSWGTPDGTGPTYVIGGTAADFNVNGVAGTHSFNATSLGRISYGQIATRDQNALTTVSISKVVIGGTMIAAIAHRVVDSSNYYRLELKFNASGVLQLNCSAIIGGSPTAVGVQQTLGITYAADEQINIRSDAIGASPTTIRIKVWKTGTTEPTAWIFTATDSSSTLQGALALGVRSASTSTITNFPIVVSYFDLESLS